MSKGIVNVAVVRLYDSIYAAFKYLISRPISE